MRMALDCRRGQRGISRGSYVAGSCDRHGCLRRAASILRYIDEIYLLFQHEYSANFLFALWKRVYISITSRIDCLKK